MVAALLGWTLCAAQGICGCLQAGGRHRSTTSAGPGAEEDEVPHQGGFQAPGDRACRAFSAKHVYRSLRRQCQDVASEALIWVLLAYPMTLRSLMQLGGCIRFPGSEEVRLEMDFDVVCSEVQGRYRNGATVVWIAVPVAILLLLFCVGRDMLSIPTRRVFVFYLEGYVPNAYYFEAFMFFRTGFIIILMDFGSLSMRVTSMFWLVILPHFVVVVIRPFQPHHRFALDVFEKLATWGSAAVLLAAVAAEEFTEVDDNFEIIKVYGDGVKTWIGIIAIALNVWVLVWAAGMCYISAIHLPVQFALAHGGTVSPAMRHVHTLVQLFWGTHKITHGVDGGRFYINASELNRPERDFLIYTLGGLIRVCLDASHFFDLRLAELALREAFIRTHMARCAMLRKTYEAWGARTHGALFGALNCWEVTLANHEVITTEDTSQGVTVEELHMALLDVGEHLFEGLGGMMLHGKAGDADERRLELQGRGSRSRPDVVIWTNNESIHELEINIQSAAAAPEPGSGEEDTPPSPAASESFIEDLEKDMARVRDDLQSEERKLRQELDVAQQKVAELRTKLSCVPDPGVRNLALGPLPSGATASRT